MLLGASTTDSTTSPMTSWCSCCLPLQRAALDPLAGQNVGAYRERMPSKPVGLVLVPGVSLVPRHDGAASPGSIRWKEELLATVPLFTAISKRHRRSIAKIASLSNIEMAEQLVTEGTPGTVFGVIVDGVLRVVKNGRTVARMGPGEFFGEVAVLDPGPRTASLVAETAGRCMKIRGQDLARLMSTEPGVGAEIARVLARRLREASGSGSHVQ